MLPLLWLMVELAERSAGWLEMHHKIMAVCTESDDSLDALVCALIARAVEIGWVLPISDHGRAVDEGWIALPLGESIPNLRGRT